MFADGDSLDSLPLSCAVAHALLEPVAPPAAGWPVNRILFRILLGLSLLPALACGRHDIEPISTTAPTTVSSGAQTGIVAPVVFSGTISAIDTAAMTIVVDGTTVSVPASAQINGGPGGAVTFAGLAVGWRVTVHATRSGSTLTATEIDVEQRGAPAVDIRGRIQALAGSCPALTFAIESIHVSTSSATVFAGAACSQLANGTQVTVDGNAQSDGSIAAARVSSDTNP
jgi:Domain of unknown function (DUF5666)